jgi:hypothetical protein
MLKDHATNSIHLAICIVCLGLLFSCSPGTEPLPPQSVRITKGPYRQNVTQHQITIMWETSQPVLGAVHYGVSGEFENEIATEIRARIHEVRLSGLSPATEYGYRVIADGITSGTHTFTTAVADGSPFRFATYGDDKDGPANHEQVTNAILAQRPAFVLHNGDLVNTGYIAKQEAIEWALTGIEILPQFTGTYEVLVEGYHELGDDDTAFEWASRWREIAPDSTGPDEAVAEIYLNRNELNAAIDALQRALVILPSDAEIHFDLGALYEEVGDSESALVSYFRGLYWFMEEHEQDEEDLEEYLEIRNRVAASLNHELASR